MKQLPGSQTNCVLLVSVWVVCSPSQAQVLLHFGSAVQTLGRMSSLQLYCPDRAGAQLSVCSTPPPERSLVGVVDHTCTVHLHLQVLQLHFNTKLSHQPITSQLL